MTLTESDLAVMEKRAKAATNELFIEPAVEDILPLIAEVRRLQRLVDEPCQCGHPRTAHAIWGACGAGLDERRPCMCGAWTPPEPRRIRLGGGCEVEVCEACFRRVQVAAAPRTADAATSGESPGVVVGSFPPFQKRVRLDKFGKVDLFIYHATDGLDIVDSEKKGSPIPAEHSWPLSGEHAQIDVEITIAPRTPTTSAPESCAEGDRLKGLVLKKDAGAVESAWQHYQTCRKCNPKGAP